MKLTRLGFQNGAKELVEDQGVCDVGHCSRRGG